MSPTRRTLLLATAFAPSLALAHAADGRHELVDFKPISLTQPVESGDKVR